MLSQQRTDSSRAGSRCINLRDVETHLQVAYVIWKICNNTLNLRGINISLRHAGCFYNGERKATFWCLSDVCLSDVGLSGVCLSVCLSVCPSCRRPQNSTRLQSCSCHSWVDSVILAVRCANVGFFTFVWGSMHLFKLNLPSLHEHNAFCRCNMADVHQPCWDSRSLLKRAFTLQMCSSRCLTEPFNTETHVDAHSAPHFAISQSEINAIPPRASTCCRHTMCC